ncbi:MULTISPECIES: ankyrin repeat domain-containing protein [Burkholderia]|uniref:Ankyrin repeat domain-containing protein n=4 Tax=Pseudomonadota TaxID=1224 RepID=A0A250LFI8_9BURK|nr:MULTISPECIES: ankyrin repeat domain-containing protein [Burkholderia]MCA7912562.1 ankyrin repeat domain-containing protein [Burkholderia contaminans]MCA8189094.1 ankyrin repeat domain-containing protein [Burkholderia contaminans]MCA8371351.1 ankyrin repeat domain-containing protein [Burkholderia contaminans]MCQ4560131.1 ankyrin repeat domain-containing protein [Burkholderia contaminans]MDE4930959.1 ankyrin repeat domain-containing protein [Burkholderia contaminans]
MNEPNRAFKQSIINAMTDTTNSLQRLVRFGQKSLRQLAGASFVALALVTTGCNMSANSPGKFFEGQYLNAAKAINDHDTARLKESLTGLNVNAAGRDDMTLLWYAILQKNYDAIRELVAHGAEPDKQVVEGLGSALHVALTNDDPHVLQAMLEGGLSPNYQDADGTTLLQRALEGEKAPEHVRLLVERGANVNLRDSIGSAALDKAIDVSKPDLAIYLVEHGADVNAHTTNGVSVAYSVQWEIDHLQPNGKSASTTAVALDQGGKPVVTTQSQPSQGATPEGHELLEKFERLRTLMIEKGAKFPPDPPAKVREQMSQK